MRIINILSLMLTFFICFSACTEEELMEEPSASTSQLQIVLSPTSVITKAGTDTKALATQEELSIHNCVLYIKDVKTSKWFEPQYISSLTKNEEETDLVYNATTVSGLTNGQELEIMVIANISESKKNQYLACGSESDIEQIIEGTDEYAFTPANLLKYSGVISHTVSAVEPRAIIPLDILAARVEFVINIEQTDVKFEKTYYEMGENLNLDIENTSYSADAVKNAFINAGYDNVIVFDNWNKVTGGRPEGELYYGDRPIKLPQGNGVKGVYIPEYKSVRVDKFKGRTFEITDIIVKNIRTQAIAILPYEEISMFNLSEYKSLNYDEKTRKYAFYTYAKEVETNSPLEVSFSGTVMNQYILKKTPVIADWFAFADSYNPRIWGSTGSDEFTLNTGWAGSTTVFFTVKNWQEDTSIELPDESSEGSSIGSYSNSFFIKGKESKMIEYGHLYNVTATIKNFTPQSTGSLDVSIQEYNTVEVPGFGFN